MLGEATVSFQSQQPDGTEDFAQMKRRTVRGYRIMDRGP